MRHKSYFYSLAFLLRSRNKKAANAKTNAAIMEANSVSDNVIDSAGFAGSGVCEAVGLGEGVMGVFGGSVTVCVSLHPLNSPKNTYGYG